ncbi:YqzE family protein [Hazenella sp. IB182357]|uniref:YqzE family protein n=1 Tax=Polycladospora coralii TaxID=2771432 RepID=A0A926N9V6_9BACL|nr:YqzE family protein [Polycladospora coralii]MBD1371225.1 YqzE family protein [Polycladospora coralii]MBS7530167.1 YqzE family protein [Polycladospora coralii]
MSFKDWFQYLLERFVWYLETPKGERKEIKQQNKQPWTYQWFGMMPFAMKMFVRKQKGRMRGRLSEK